jgi:hypothetical protein
MLAKSGYDGVAHRRGPLRASVVTLLFVVILLVLPSAALFGSAAAAAAATEIALGGTVGPVNVILILSPTTTPLSPLFWGTTVSAHANLLPTEASLIESTPANVLVWPGANAGDAYDWRNDTIHELNGVRLKPQLNESQFVTLCLAVRCTAIFQVPGEINSSSTAAAMVDYTESTLHFHPAYWEIGNEPALWRAWNVPWNRWSLANATATAPLPGAYAWLVKQYISAMRAVDPTIRIIGLPGVGKGNYALSQWVKDTVSVNGPNLSAIAIHEYPANGNLSGLSLTQYYATLHDRASIPSRVPLIRHWISSACSSCNISLFLTEIGSAVSKWSYARIAAGFPGVLEMAAQMTQAMSLSLTNVDQYASVFDTVNSWIELNGTERPLYGLYSSILPHLGTLVDNVSVSASVSGLTQSIYAIATLAPSAGNRSDLLVVNTNTTTNATFFPVLPGGVSSPTEVWTWVNNSTRAPTATFSPTGVPSAYTLPPQSLALFETYPFPESAGPLQFIESGLPTGTRWFVTVNGAVSSSAGSNLTLFVPTGNYPTSVLTLEVRDHAAERFEPFAPSSVQVGTSPTWYAILFARQWTVAVEVSPAGTGYVSPNPSWANASAPLTLTATAGPGFVFRHWFGWGPGSINGTVNPAVVLPSGPVTEKAVFSGGYPVLFSETGLPAGTKWSVALRGVTNSSVSSTIGFYTANGSFGFLVEPPAGYRAHPPAGSVNVTGASVEVLIAFQVLTPPAPRYNVSFVESGLPAGTDWSVEVRNVSMNTTTSTLTFREANGTSGFKIGNVSGYRAHPPAGSVNVSGAEVRVPIVFQKLTPPGARYAVTFAETGLPSGTNWSVLVRNVTIASTTQNITFHEANGTSGYAVGNVSGYRAHPPAGSVNVTGAAVRVTIAFQPLTPPGARYTVTFIETGLPGSALWSIVVRNESVSSTGISLTFEETNGTYGYTVGPVPAYRLNDTNHGFAVRGAPTTVEVHFTRTVYWVVWNETGLWKGVSWIVSVNGTTYPSTGSWVSARLPNGSYLCSIQASLDWVPGASHPTVQVSGADTIVNVTFTRAKYPVVFFERGLPANLSWQVRFSDVNLSPTIEASEVEAHTEAPNGSYTFDVVAPHGYYPKPSHGVFAVHAGPANLTITFVLTGPLPIPSIWFLGPRAIVVAAVIALSSWGGFALFRRLGRPPGDGRADS